MSCQTTIIPGRRGFLLGNAVSVLSSGYISQFIASSLGLNWEQSIRMDTLGITFIILLVLVLSVTIRMTGKLKRVTIITALRSGVDTFHFGKNYFPLDRTHGGLTYLLGLNGLFNGKRQNISVGIIGMIMSVALIFACNMYLQLVSSSKLYIEPVGKDNPNIAVTCTGEESRSLFSRLENEEGVESTCHYTVENVTLVYQDRKTATLTKICDDYAKTKVNTMVEGRMPKQDNEIALSYAIRDELDVNIGDVIALKKGEKLTEYVVVGLMQHISYLCKSAAMTEEGMLRYNTAFMASTLYLYLDEEHATEDVIHRITPIVSE